MKALVVNDLLVGDQHLVGVDRGEKVGKNRPPWSSLLTQSHLNGPLVVGWLVLGEGVGVGTAVVGVGERFGKCLG